jgi:orotate phosphoribosyltransferase
VDVSDRLLELLRTRSFRHGRFTLASGRESDFFIDCKPVVLSAEGHALVGPRMLHAIESFEGAPPVAVCGVVLGGCPLASAVALASYHQDAAGALDAVYVRKEAKDHGSKKRLEGADHLPAGARVAVVEDTVTTGGSTISAVGALREAGLDVVGVVAIVDRLEGAAEAFAAANLPFRALFSRRDFLPEPAGSAADFLAGSAGSAADFIPE